MSVGGVHRYQTSARREGIARRNYFSKRCDLVAHKAVNMAAEGLAELPLIHECMFSLKKSVKTQCEHILSY
jgi:hypothetical protein